MDARMTQPETALVTGANRGIGLEVCRQLAAKGYRVVLTARNRSKAEQAARTLASHGAVEAVALDVTDSSSVLQAAREVEDGIGQVDVLINNAAILVAERKGVLGTTREEFRETFETNVLGVISVCQAFVPGMVRRKRGRVVNVSSRAGQLSGMGQYAPAYSISKTALNAFTVQLANASRNAGVLVNAACPGWVRTDMGGPGAPRSVEQGADTIVWLATLPDNGPTGGFFEDRKRIEW
jgi:NAD(P)-dependent dehydrogenase (short-subunit alcohol dehydrogenase family)